jgi:hypothetical protein
MGWGRLELCHGRGLEPGSYLRPAPSRRIVASTLRTGGPRHPILASNAVTARARSGGDVVPLSVFISPRRHRRALWELAWKTISRLHDAWQGRSRDDRRAHMRDWGSLAAEDFGPALRRNGSDAEVGKWMKSVETDNATRNARACARVMGCYWRSRNMTLASDQTSPGRRKGRRLCGAKTRAGGSCQVRAEPGKARCRFHGGKSTGPKTPAGRARIAEAQRRRWLAYRDGIRAVRNGNATGSER